MNQPVLLRHGSECATGDFPEAIRSLGFLRREVPHTNDALGRCLYP